MNPLRPSTQFPVDMNQMPARAVGGFETGEKVKQFNSANGAAHERGLLDKLTLPAGSPVPDFKTLFGEEPRRLCDLIQAGTLGVWGAQEIGGRDRMEGMEVRMTLHVQRLIRERKVQMLFADEMIRTEDGLYEFDGKGSWSNGLCTRPPFDRLWIEMQDIGVLFDAGVHLSWRENNEDREVQPVVPPGHIVTTGWTFMRVPSQIVKTSLASRAAADRVALLKSVGWQMVAGPVSCVTMILDERGVPTKQSWSEVLDNLDNKAVVGLGKDGCAAMPWAPRDAPIGQVLGTTRRAIDGACRALQMLSCKNVKLVPSSRDLNREVPADRRQREKRGQFRYHVLQVDVPGGKRYIGGQGGTGEPLPLHVVRGHPRTYKEGGPGMFGKGKTYGTFWIPDHLAGDAKVGIIEKDYVLKERRDASDTQA